MANIYLQNKQENGGGASVVSPMPKSDLFSSREKSISVFSQECLTFYGVLPSSFMEEGSCPLYMGIRRFLSETEGECGVLFKYHDLFFPLYGQTALQMSLSSAFDCH